MATVRLNFGEWLPDQPAVVESLKSATNVVPLAIGYESFPSSENYSNAASENLLTAFAGKFGTSTVLFAGGASKLFKFNASTLNLDDVSKSGGYTTDKWSIVQFGKTILAANNSAKIQAWTLGTSTAFNDVSANAPVAKYITIVRDFVVAGYLDSGTNANKLQWSDINDETNWVSGSGSQSDFQFISQGNNITGLTGGEFGLVFMDTAVVRMSYIGSPYFWQFDVISNNIGCLDGGSIAQYGKTSFFLSDNGFYSCDGTSLTPIGNNKVDNYFFSTAELSNIKTISAAVDPTRKIVVWNYPNVSGGRSMLMYNFVSNKWSSATTSAYSVNSIATVGYTLEDLNVFGSLDSITTSLDDRLWVGGKFLFAGTTGARISTFTGTPMPATITTSDIEQGYNSVVTLVRPQIDNGSASVAVASRKNLDGTITFGSQVNADAEGRVPLRSAGRYHRFNVVPSGNWTNAIGIDIDITSQGDR